MDPKQLENDFSLHIEVDNGQPKHSELIITTHPEQDGNLRRDLQRFNRSEAIPSHTTKDGYASNLLSSTKRTPSECSYPRYARPSRQETPMYGSSITCMQCQYIPESGIDSENLNLLRSRDLKFRPPYHEKINVPADNIKTYLNFCQPEVNNQCKNTVQNDLLQAAPSKLISRSTPSFNDELVSDAKENLMKDMTLPKENMLEDLKQEPPEIILPTTTRESVAVQTDCAKHSTCDIGLQINSKSEVSQQDNPVHVNNGSETKNPSKSSTLHDHKYEEAQNKHKFEDEDVKCIIKNLMNKSDAIFDHEDIRFKTGYIVMFVITIKLFVLWLVAQIFVLAPYITFGDSFNDNNFYYLFCVFSKIVYFLNSETVIW